MSSSGKVAETFNPSVGQPRRTSLCTTFASQARVTGLGLSYLEHSDAQACYGQFSSHGLEWDDIWTISDCDLCPDGGATNQTFSIERDRLLEDQVGRLGRKDVLLEPAQYSDGDLTLPEDGVDAQLIFQGYGDPELGHDLLQYSPGHPTFADLSWKTGDLDIDLFHVRPSADLTMYPFGQQDTYSFSVDEPDVRYLLGDDSSKELSSSQLNNPSYHMSSGSNMSCCGQEFGDVSDLRAHKETIHRQSHHCNKLGCNESFTEARSLPRHIKTRHSKKRTFFCPHTECELSQTGFNRKDSMLKHCRRKHDEALGGRT